MILTPTRELTVQVTAEIEKFARYTGIRTVSIYGGQSIGIQYNQLRKGVQIVIATPGRLIDHIKRGSIRLEEVKFAVLDEADRMLDMGFVDDIKYILSYMRKDRQTCLFSATMPREVLRLAQEYMVDPKEIRLNEKELSLDTIDQSYLVVHEKEKFKHLCNFIRNKNERQTIVFAATKQRTHRLASELKQEGFKAITMHGDLSQAQRDSAMYKFRKGFEDILVATDIAARGIDVPAVGHVINYDIPADPLIYFHRIGRTARAGGAGKAISLVSQDRVDDFGRILKTTEKPIHKLNEEMGIEVPSVPQDNPGILDKNLAVIIGGITGIVTETILTLVYSGYRGRSSHGEKIQSHYTSRNRSSNNRYGADYGRRRVQERHTMKCKMSIERSASGVIMDKALSRVREDFIR